MIEETYCTFELAKKLKEKGFPVEYVSITGLEDFPCCYIEPDKDCIAWANNTGIKCPTLSLVQKWLREEKNIYVQISIDFSGKYYGVFFDTKHSIGTIINDTDMYITYEEALEAGINKALELI